MYVCVCVCVYMCVCLYKLISEQIKSLSNITTSLI